MTEVERIERPDVAQARAGLTTALMGRYHIGDFLGAGRGGAVFRARHLASKRNVALKTAWSEPGPRSQVLREFSLTSQVVHPNVITMRRIDVPDPLVVVEMPLVMGGTLHDLIDSGVRTPFPRTLEILRGVGAALDQAHRSGIVHGTLCPVKFLIDESGQVLLSDFGLRIGVGSDSGAVRPSALGSPAYTPLEQRHDSPEMGGRADQYALAIIAFEMLRGRRTWRFNSERVLEVDAIEIPTHRAIAAEVPLSANAAIRRGTSKDPSFRYENIADFVRHYAGETATVVAAEHLQHDIVVVQKGHGKIWLAAGGLILIVAALGIRPEVRDSVRGWWHLKLSADMIPRPSDNESDKSVSAKNPPGTQAGGATQRGGESRTRSNTRLRDTSRAGATGPDRAIDPYPRTSPRQNAPPTTAAAPTREESRRVAPPPVAPIPSTPGRASSDTGVRRTATVPGLISNGRVDDPSTGVIAVTLNGGTAAVFIDGTLRGSTPLSWRASAGTHVIKLRGLGRFSPDSMVVTTIVSDTVKAVFRTASPP